MNISLSEIYGNTNKQWNEMKKSVLYIKVEIEPVKKI